jgi:hypothetical protein
VTTLHFTAGLSIRHVLFVCRLAGMVHVTLPLTEANLPVYAPNELCGWLPFYVKAKEETH